MIPTIDKRALAARMAARAAGTDRRVTETVQAILDDVRERGDEALRQYTRQFDGADEIRVLSKDDITARAKACPLAITAALERAAANIREFHEKQLPRGFIIETDGVRREQRVRGLARVGIYVPGGTAAYPSSVLMNAIPARIAGVDEIIMVTPPRKDAHEQQAAVMAAAYIAGVDKVILCGGAQAIAALAYGTRTIPRVDKIVGPGNAYVAAAKRLVYGAVDIDMIAGPSEIVVIADKDADPVYVAADLLSQAEHDALASAVLLTDSGELAAAVAEQIGRQIVNLPRQDIARRSLRENGAVCVCTDIEEALGLANELAPEHLELLCANAWERSQSVRNAGSVFVGPWTPEPVGDYYAGLNHVLPTAGTARFFSPLSVDSFLKRMSVVEYTQSALTAAADDIMTLAEAEGLNAHAGAVKARIEKHG